MLQFPGTDIALPIQAMSTIIDPQIDLVTGLCCYFHEPTSTRELRGKDQTVFQID